MLSPESKSIRATLVRDPDAPDVPLAVARRQWEAAAAQAALPAGVTVTPVDVAGITGEWINGTDSTQAVLYHLHGGGYTSGSRITHREFAARLCLASGARVLLPDYRLAPEHPFPAAVQDAAAGYQWLLAQGIQPKQIVISGDSAGGGLAVAAMLLLRERAVPLPAASALLSPWLDLALTGPSLSDHAAADPLVSREGLLVAANHYLAGENPTNPLASPLYADLHGLPPLLIHVGGDEALLSDTTRFTERAEAAGVDVGVEVWEGMWHFWHTWAGTLPEGQQALDCIGAFVRRRLAIIQNPKSKIQNRTTLPAQSR